MTMVAMEIFGSGGEKFPTLPLDIDWEAGLQIYCERRWPVGRRKAVEAEWNLSVDDARCVVEGKASKRVISKIWKHPRGGWTVAIPVMGAVIGQPIHEFFRAQNESAAREAANAMEDERLANIAYGRLAAHAARTGEDRRSWPRSREVGAEEARRMAGDDR